MHKTSQIQIRVSQDDKDLIRAAAARSGLDMSTWILQRLLLEPDRQFRHLLAQLSRSESPALFVELISFLENSTAAELRAIENRMEEFEALGPIAQNYVCALVEQRAYQLGTVPPAWVRSIPPLTDPYFGTRLKSLRPYLLVNSPVAFKRRNIFIDSGLGARV